MSGSIERTLELPGRGTSFVREIAGPKHAPTLVLLHGLSATGLLNWGPSLHALGQGFRVLALDQRGHGRGIRLRGRFRLEDCADDAVALADLLEIDQIVPVGYSMGGPVAQLIWRRHRERVAGLVLCATAGHFADRRQRQAAALLSPLISLAARATPGSVWKEAGGRALQNIEHPEMRQRIQQEVSGTNPAAVVEAGAALARFDSGRWVGRIDVPTAVVVTLQDQLVEPARQLELAEAIPGSTTHRVNADHYACVARPDLFVPTLFEACRSVAVRRAVRVTG